MNLSTPESMDQMASRPRENSKASKARVATSIAVRAAVGERRRGPKEFGNHAVAILLDHGQRAAGEVAQAVGEFGVVAADQRVETEAAVLPEDDFAEQEVAQGFEAHHLADGLGAHDVAARLAHLVVLEEQPAVGEDALRQRDVGGHQEGGPEDGVEAQDFLADQMQVGGPEVLGTFAPTR